MTDPEAFDRRLSQAWQTFSPPPGLERRVRARLAASQSAASAARSASSVAMSKLRALRASGALGASAAALLLGLGFAAGFLARPAEPVPVPPLPSRSSAAAPADLELVLPAEGSSSLPSTPSASAGAPAPASRAERSRRSEEEQRPARAAAQSASTTSHDELQLLARAERALRARHPELALALATELEQRHPTSLLQEERSAIALLAHCQRDPAGTRSLAERFTRRYPDSVYAERIASGCSLTIGAAADMDGAKGGNLAQPQNP